MVPDVARDEGRVLRDLSRHSSRRTRSVPAIGARDRGHRDKIAGRPEALQRLEEAARGMWHAELYDRGLTRPDEWPGIAFERRKDITPAPAALSLLGRIHNLLEME